MSNWTDQIDSNTSTSTAYDVAKQAGQSNPHATLVPIEQTNMTYDQYINAQAGLADSQKNNNE